MRRTQFKYSCIDMVRSRFGKKILISIILLLIVGITWLYVTRPSFGVYELNVKFPAGNIYQSQNKPDLPEILGKHPVENYRSESIYIEEKLKNDYSKSKQPEKEIEGDKTDSLNQDKETENNHRKVETTTETSHTTSTHFTSTESPPSKTISNDDNDNQIQDNNEIDKIKDDTIKATDDSNVAGDIENVDRGNNDYENVDSVQSTIVYSAWSTVETTTIDYLHEEVVYRNNEPAAKNNPLTDNVSQNDDTDTNVDTNVENITENRMQGTSVKHVDTSDKIVTQESHDVSETENDEKATVKNDINKESENKPNVESKLKDNDRQSETQPERLKQIDNNLVDRKLNKSDSHSTKNVDDINEIKNDNKSNFGNTIIHSIQKSKSPDTNSSAINSIIKADTKTTSTNLNDTHDELPTNGASETNVTHPSNTNTTDRTSEFRVPTTKAISNDIKQESVKPTDADGKTNSSKITKDAKLLNHELPKSNRDESNNNIGNDTKSDAKIPNESNDKNNKTRPNQNTLGNSVNNTKQKLEDTKKSIKLGSEENVDEELPKSNIDETISTYYATESTIIKNDKENIKSQVQATLKPKQSVKDHGEKSNTDTSPGKDSNTDSVNKNVKDRTSKTGIEVHKNFTGSDRKLKIPPEQNTSSIKSENNDSSKVKVLSNKKIAIIIAYMRTGSSLTGDILEQYSKTFYVFEPARPIDRLRRGGGTLGYINGTTRKYSSADHEEVVLNELKSWLTCDLNNLSLQTLTERAAERSRYMSPFRECYLASNKSEGEIRDCLQSAIKACKRAPLIAIKYIRLRIQAAGQLFPYFPNMKIIHLVRDPRGIYNSRKNIYPNLDPSGLSCDTTLKDLQVSKTLRQTYPGRIKILRYEDMAERPYVKSKALANFVGIEYSDKIENFLKSRMSAPKDNCTYCTSRADSAVTASRWRETLSFDESNRVYKNCRESNKYLGYLPFLTAEKQRNLKLPSTKQYENEWTI